MFAWPLAWRAGAVIGRPDVTDARSEVAVEKPHGHFEVTQASGLPAARVKASLNGGAYFHVFEMKIHERLGGLVPQMRKIFPRDHGGRE